MSVGYETVEGLLGDFFERNTAGDKEGMKSVIDTVQRMIETDEIDSSFFKEYFNNMYAGRGAVNFAVMAKDYPRESIMRELLQNVFGCDYESPDIKVMIEFLDEGQVKMTYNETGFTLQQVFFYLAVGRNDGDTRREGRFGLGAKSVFANVEWFRMRSNRYSLRVVNDEGTLKVDELELKASQFNHTEIMFALPEDEQARLHKNLTTLTSQKGPYINMVDLCFAFVNKKYLRSVDEEECPNRTINIAVINFGKPEVIYKIQQQRRDENDIPKVRFIENGKSVADFIHAERDGFTYLIPFAISGAKRDAAKVLMAKYNYFSIFELTGFVRAQTREFIDEQLSAFFVSVPNKFITNNRSGIKYESLEECSQKIEQGILSVADDYKRLFILELVPRSDARDLYMLRPKQYVFEFFYNYVNTSGIAKGLHDTFGNSVSVQFPDGTDPVQFQEIRRNGFFTERSGLSKEEHDDGSAAQALYEDIEQMNTWYGKDDNHTFAARYNWQVAGTDEGGEEYLYCFFRNGERYYMASDGGKRVKDYSLGAAFKSIISLKLNDCIINGSVANEDALAEAFSIIDEMFGENYRIAMKYFQFIITSGAAQIQFEISKIDIENLKKAYDVLLAHEMRFENHQIFNQVVTLIVNSFTNGKDTIQALKEIRSQGGEVALALDINKRYRFSVYGKQFMIPPNITNTELLDIVADVYALIESGLFNKREFDFPYYPGRFSFDAQEIVAALPYVRNTNAVEQTLEKIFVCDLGLDRIALLDNKDRLIKIVDLTDPIGTEDKVNTSKFVILRDNMSKPQFAGFVEFILTGKNKNILRGLYSGTEEPNLIIIDQLPYYYKPVPGIRQREYEYLRSEVCRIASYEKDAPKFYKNYFARDINSKLFGYGGVCPCCGYETSVLNCFTVKNFSIGMMNGEKEQKFKFSLYLCRNDAAAAAGWIIDDVSIGGMIPFRWLNEISDIDVIPPEFLYCRIKYRRQVTYDICEPSDESTILDNVIEGVPETLDFVLSPMMAAKWFEDNINLVESENKPEEDDKPPMGSDDYNVSRKGIDFAAPAETETPPTGLGSVVWDPFADGSKSESEPNAEFETKLPPRSPSSEETPQRGMVRDTGWKGRSNVWDPSADESKPKAESESQPNPAPRYSEPDTPEQHGNGFTIKDTGWKGRSNVWDPFADESKSEIKPESKPEAAPKPKPKLTPRYPAPEGVTQRGSGYGAGRDNNWKGRSNIWDPTSDEPKSDAKPESKSEPAPKPKPKLTPRYPAPEGVTQRGSGYGAGKDGGSSNAKTRQDTSAKDIKPRSSQLTPFGGVDPNNL